jgi:methyltransferase (TIGR00027 family)
MIPGTVSKTALGTAAGRALETFRPVNDRLFSDRFAMRFLPLAHRMVVHLLRIPVLGPALLAGRERQIPGVMGNLLCRTRFIDDMLREALGENIHQLLILGAGLDSRAYRIDGSDDVRVFEVDHPATQLWKQRRIIRIFNGTPPHVTFVPVDFDREDLGRALTEAGFRREIGTVVIWEGVTQYISEKAVNDTFAWLSGNLLQGSRIIFTYVRKDLIEDSGQTGVPARLLAELRKQGEPWKFGIEPEDLDRFLSERGFSLIANAGAEDYRERYPQFVERRLDIFDGERTAVAVIPGRSEL